MDRMELLARLGDLANAKFGEQMRGTSNYGPTGDAIECQIALANEHGYKSLNKFVREDWDAAVALVNA